MGQIPLLSDIVLGFSRVIEPLEESFKSSGSLFLFLSKLGWEGDFDDEEVQAIRGKLNWIASAKEISELAEQLRDPGSVGSLPESIRRLINMLDSVLSGVRQALSATTMGTSVHPFDKQAFWDSFSSEIVDVLVFEYMRKYQAPIFAVLQFFGVFDVITVPGDLGTGRKRFDRREVHWTNFPRMISEPTRLLNSMYGWGDTVGGFKSDYLMERLGTLTQILGFAGSVSSAIPEEASQFFPSSYGYPVSALLLPLFTYYTETEPGGPAIVSLEVTVVPIPPAEDTSKPPSRLLLYPRLHGSAKTSFELADTLKLNMSGNFETTRGIQAIVDPGGVSAVSHDGSGNETKALIELVSSQAEPIVLLGRPDTAHIQVGDFRVALFLESSGSSYDLGLELGVQRASIVIRTDDGDGFLRKILPSDPIELTFDFGIGYSSRRSIYLSGGAGFEYSFQINKALGPIQIDTVDLRLEPRDAALSLITGFSGSASIGPVSASVERLGLKTSVDFSKKGILGDADLSIEFCPPTAIGLAIEAAGISGGGFIEIDPPNYAGALSLSFQDQISITAFALITTKLPDGSDGYSLLISILAQFQPIQLSFGFALVGVGGLIGINREMKEDALRSAVINHTLDDILFPPNPIKDAVRIINSIKTIFPPCEGHYVFGPMVKIIWGGALPLVQFEVGIFIELGGPVRIALLGLAHSALPDPALPLLSINVQVLGFIDFGNETLAIDASLYDSRLLQYTLSGQMALRANWGENPDFALSVGGFHPRYSPPANFPSLERLMVAMGAGDFHVALTTYFAITTNTLQLGAQVSLAAEIIGFSVEGGYGFDALIIFSPFSFDVDIGAWLTISLDGSELASLSAKLNLTGPNPFHIEGKVKIEIWFVSVKIPIRATFGDKEPENQISASPLAELTSQLKDARNVRFELPAWASADLIFAKEAQTLLDPLGDIIISQHAVPLETQLDKFGGGTPPEGERILSVNARDEAGSLLNPPTVTNQFAPAQFKDMSDDEKLSAPPFEEMPSGIRLSGEYLKTSKDSCRSLNIEFESILHEKVESGGTGEYTLVRPFTLAGDKGRQLMLGWSLAGSSKRFKPRRKVRDPHARNSVDVQQSTFCLGDDSISNQNGFAAKSEAVSYSKARDLLKTNAGGGTVIMDSAFVSPGK
jgi:hypothetical protein